MTDTCIESAQKWVERLESELTELQARSDYRKQVHVADGIGREIERVRRVIESSKLRRNQKVTS